MHITVSPNGARPSAPSLPRVVIVGGGFAGLHAAQALASAPVHVTIVDRNNYHLFQPLLYQVATADLSPANISAPIRAIFRRHRNVAVLLAEAMGVDVAGRQVLIRELAPIAGGERAVPYDYLILAPGVDQSYFGHPEWQCYAPGLKSIPDATAIRRKILLAFEAAELEPDPERRGALLTFVVVGGGPTGVELAGAIAELARNALAKDFRHINPATERIILVEAVPHILGAFPASLARKALRRLERLGVEVRTNSPVERVEQDAVVIGGERLPAQVIAWSAGVAASPAGAWLGVKTDRAGRVQVNPDLTVPGHPEIFVIGDTASFVQDGKPVPGVAPAAMQEGTYAGRTIRDRLAGADQSSKPFRYVDKGNLAVIGRAYAIADFGWLRVSGLLAWLLWLAVHIYYLIDFRNRVLVMTQWAWAFFAGHHSARLIVFDEHQVEGQRPQAGAPQREAVS
jgi:NADH dehydrogenase